jgi:hypothetical protein
MWNKSRGLNIFQNALYIVMFLATSFKYEVDGAKGTDSLGQVENVL